MRYPISGQSKHGVAWDGNSKDETVNRRTGAYTVRSKTCTSYKNRQNGQHVTARDLWQPHFIVALTTLPLSKQLDLTPTTL
jgi:hypothetical protein